MMEEKSTLWGLRDMQHEEISRFHRMEIITFAKNINFIIISIMI